MNEEAVNLLRAWLDYYDGKGLSAGLRKRTKDLLDAEDSRFKPTPEEEERMRQ